MRPRAMVDPALCIGSGTCVHLAPDAFALDDEGVAVALEAPPEADDKVVLAARSCPTAAITVTHDDPDAVR